jgi:hypothetical protein
MNARIFLSHPSRLRRVVGIGAVWIAAMVGAMAGAPAVALTTAASPGFGEPTPAGVFGNGFETDVRLDDTGTNQIAYEGAPQSLSSTISTLQRSLDGGKTFKLVPGSASGLSGGKNFTCPAGGGDVELDVDPSGHLYYTDLTLANFSVARSDDKATTFNAGTNCAGVPDSGVDRPWLTHLGDPTAGGAEFQVYDRFAQSTPPLCPVATAFNNLLVVARSPVLGAPASTAGIQYSPSLGLSCDEGIMGNDETFDYSAQGGGPEFFVIHDNAALNSISVVRCDIGPESLTNPTGLTNCADHLVASFGPSPNHPGSVTGANFPTMAVDDRGGLFAVWEQAPGMPGAVTGNTSLEFATSSDKGTTWTHAQKLPTGNLFQNVFAWPGAGDPGRVDVAFYGAPEKVSGNFGPDSTVGHYGLYMVQTLDNGASWSAPVLASEHIIHVGTMSTLLGGQNGNRTLGDFIQMRIGPQGEANISFADSNNQDSGFNPQGMFVRQNSGPSVFANANGTGSVSLPAAPAGGCVTDPTGDATFDAADAVGPNNPNLDLTGVCMSQPDTLHYRVTMTIANLGSLAPGAQAGGTTLIWQTQWHEPSSGDLNNGGALFMVYAESVNGATPTCWAGQNAAILVGGGVELTYPGTTQLTGSACSVVQGAPGTITITVPKSVVSVPSPDSTILYSVTASTQTLIGNAETPPPIGGLGGQLFNVIDVASAFDFQPS